MAVLSDALTPELCAGAQSWLQAPVKRMTKEDEPTTLFVLEGSWAAVPRSSEQLEWIGTDDATTCMPLPALTPSQP